MDESTALREKFEELSERLASVDDAEVLGVFVDAREEGLVSKGLDAWINQLRDEAVEPSEAREWVAEVVSGEENAGDESGLSALPEAPVVDSERLDTSSAVDFALVGESVTSDKIEPIPADDEERVVVQLDESSASEVEAAQSASASEEDAHDDSLFDDLGDLMAEAGKQAIEEVKEFKLPKLQSTKKLSLSGDERKKLSKRFSIPNPTRDVPSLAKEEADADQSNETPIAGLKALQGLVANEKRSGEAPQGQGEGSGDEGGGDAGDAGDAGDDLFGLGSLDVEGLVDAAADMKSEAKSDVADPADGDVTLFPAGDRKEESETEAAEVSTASDDGPVASVNEDVADESIASAASEASEPESLELALETIGDDPASRPESEPAPQPEPEPEPEKPAGLDFDLGFDDLDEESAEDESSGDAGGFGSGPGMGSLFDDDELAEIEGAGKETDSSEEDRRTSGSSPGVRYESGKSGARYAGKAPPPPTHRLRGGQSPGPAMTGFSVEDEPEEDDFELDFGMGGSANNFGAGAADADSSEPEVTEEDDDFDFDLGLTNPEHEQGTAAAGVPLGQESSVQEDDDFDFDLGFENPADKVEEVADFDLDFDQSSVALELAEDSRGVTKGPPGILEGASGDGGSTEEREDYDALKRQAVRSDVVGSVDARREHQPTPMRHEAIQRPNRAQQPTPMARDRSGGASGLGEDEFDDLYESFDGGGEQYRGEPLVGDSSEVEEVKAAQDNPFAHEAPTGVHHAAVESSFVLEEISAADDATGTNLAAILLEARRLYENGDFDQSMDIVQKVLSREPSQEALELKQAIEGELERKELDKLGSLAKVPTLKVSMNELGSLDLDHRAGFLLSQIDGMMAFEDLLELSSMSRYETLTVLTDLLEKDVITVQ